MKKSTMPLSFQIVSFSTFPNSLALILCFSSPSSSKFSEESHSSPSTTINTTNLFSLSNKSKTQIIRRVNIFLFNIQSDSYQCFVFVYSSEHSSLSEPPTKIAHYEQFDSSSNSKQIRKSRHRTISKVSIENTTPANPVPSTLSSSSSSIDTNGMILSKKRSCAEIAAAAILSSNHTRKKRVQRKKSDEILSNNNSIKQELLAINHSSIELINDELLKRLSQGKISSEIRTNHSFVFCRFRRFCLCT